MVGRGLVRSLVVVGSVMVCSSGLLAPSACTSVRATPPRVAIKLPARVTGANVRPVGDVRRGYGTDTARQTFERLQRLGVNTLGVLLEGRMRDLHDPNIRLPSSDDREATVRALSDAHDRGLATILIPHLYAEDGAWRGELAWEDQARAEAWWAAYEAFMVDAAELAARGGATVLSLGVELKALSKQRESYARMERVARHVRAVFPGQLTYSANWDEAEDVLWWNLVDLAGVNGYYPLTPDPARGAEEVARRLSRLALLADRPVLVLEVGYRASALSHVRPWEWPEQIDAATLDPEAQARAYAAMLAHWLEAPGVRGLLLWVVPTDPDDPASEPAHGFNPLNRPAEQVIRRAFLGEPESAS